MSLIGDLFIKIKGDNSDYNRSLNDSKQKTSAFGGAVKKIGGLIAGAFAVSSIVNFAKKAVEAYDIQAKAEQQLLTALKGRKDAQRELISQAKILQRTTLFGDEETIKAQALLAAFVKEKEQIKTIIPLVQDLASAKMMQLSVAADLVSKTLGSSTNALSRYGIEVTGAVGSQERLLSLQKGLNDAFGGQAEAAAKAGVGALKQLSNAWGDFMEAVGSGGSDNINQLARALTLLVQSVTDGMTEGKVKAEAYSTALVKALSTDIKDMPVEDKIKTVQSKIDEYEKRLKIAKDEIPSYWSRIFSLGKYKERKQGLQAIDEYETKIKDLKDLLSTFKPTSASDDFEKQVSLLQAAKQAARDASVELEAFKNKSGKFAGEKSAQAYIDKLNELTEAAQKAQGFVNNLNRQEAPTAITPVSATSVTVGSNPDTSTLGDMSGFLKQNAKKNKEAMAAYMKDWTDFVTELNDTIESGMADAITSLASGLGQLATGAITGKDFGKQVLGVIGKFMQMMGGLFITMGVSMLQMQASLATLNPFGVIAAGVALTVAGAAISSLASKGPSGAASGGGNYSAASGYSGSSKNTQAELSGNVTFELRGDKLVGVLDNTSRRRSVMG